MSEESLNQLINEIKEKSYVPNEYIGVSDIKVVHLTDILDLIEQYRDNKQYYPYWQ